MELKDEIVINAPRDRVYEALNNPEVLKQCIPGCEELNQEGEDGFSAMVVVKIGPVKAKFNGVVHLKDKNYPESYRIEGEGKGGIAGFANGGANVHLTESGQETLLSYNVDANVGGKLAQLGSRLIKSTSAKLAGRFFENFSEIATERASQTA